MLLLQGPGNLLRLGVIMFGVPSVPSILAARIGAVFSKRRVSGENGKQVGSCQSQQRGHCALTSVNADTTDMP
jgi:hypothetical protein